MAEYAKNLIIYGSPKSNSFTAKLLKEELKNLDGDFDVFNCFETPPKPCDACNACEVEYGCKNKDLDLFFKKFEMAQNIILAFPVYNGSFPAPLKALIDRFQWLYSARFSQNIKPPIKNKRNCVLVITKGSDTDYTNIILEQIKPLFTISGCTLKRVVMLKNTDNMSVTDELNPTITNFD